MPLPCYCGSHDAFEDCCSVYLSGQATPQSPEQLMRSRFSAFVLGNADYLIETHHPSKRTQLDAANLKASFEQTRWKGLRVVQAPPPIADTGTVEFVAFFEEAQSSGDGNSENGIPGQLHEQSQFVRENGKWFYLDGEFLPPIKIQRNDACICGSGKKYKKCCGR